MATTTADLNDVFFSSDVATLGSKKIGVPTDQFTAGYLQGMYDPELTKPEGYEVPDIKEEKQVLDVPGGSEPLDADISEAVMLFGEEDKESERKKLGTYADPIAAQLQEMQRFQGSGVTKLRATMPQYRGI